MTTFVLGAGASRHAGYPLCSELWPKMAAWVIETAPPDSESRKTIDQITALNGPVTDIEAVLTDLDLGRGVFSAFEEDDRTKITVTIRRCIRAYFKSIHNRCHEAALYLAFAPLVSKSDLIVTLNYDTALENALIQEGKFRVRNGYGFPADWGEPESDITVLKPHGSINWIASLFGGRSSGTFGAVDSLGSRPFVDNVDSVLSTYPDRVLDNSFAGGGVTDSAVTLILPTYDKRFYVKTGVGEEWRLFYHSLWLQAAESLERSARIVIIGYSLPKGDRMARSVLLWNTNKRAEVQIYSGSANFSIRTEFQQHGFWHVFEMGRFEHFLGRYPATGRLQVCRLLPSDVERGPREAIGGTFPGCSFGPSS